MVSHLFYHDTCCPYDILKTETYGAHPLASLTFVGMDTFYNNVILPEPQIILNPKKN